MHGPDTTGRVIAASAILFGGTDLRAADAGVFEVLAGEMPTHGAAAATCSTPACRWWTRW